MARFWEMLVVVSAVLVGCQSVDGTQRERVVLSSLTVPQIDVRPKETDLVFDGPDVTTVDVDATLTLPVGATGKVPAVVLVGSSGGITSTNLKYATQLNDAGFATLVVDTLGPRGVHNLVDQGYVVSVASEVADAYAGLRFLNGDPRIDADRIFLSGNSYGGTVAIAAAFSSVASQLTEGSERFRAFNAVYPWCGHRFPGQQPTAPIFMQLGGMDVWTPAADCEQLAADYAGTGLVRVSLYPDAYHLYDGGGATNGEIEPVVGASSWETCYSAIDETGHASEWVGTCIEKGNIVTKRDDEIMRQARDERIAFFRSF